MNIADTSALQALYAAPRARVDGLDAAGPLRLADALRHVAAALNLLQCAGFACLFCATFTHEPDVAPVLLLFALAPAASVLALWPCRRAPWVNVASAGINAAWVLAAGGWLLFGGPGGWVMETVMVGPQALALGLQCAALSGPLRRRFQA